MQEQQTGQPGSDGGPGGEILWDSTDRASALPPGLGRDGAVGALGSKPLTVGLPQGAPWAPGA